MTGLLVGFAALAGLAIGSFLNVVIWRVPRSESVVSPPSACPGCGARIRARDNVPVLGWLLLRGRCRDCGAPISIRYPIVEVATGAMFALVAYWMGTSWALPAFLYFAAISVALTLIDIDVKRLPDAIVLPSYVVAIGLLVPAAFLSGNREAVVRMAVGSVCLLALYALIFLAAALVYAGGGMGLGDVKLAGVLGLYLGYLGYRELVTGVFLGFFVGGLVGVVLILMGKRKAKIPFGPYMIAGAWLGALVGAPIANWYLEFAQLT